MLIKSNLVIPKLELLKKANENMKIHKIVFLLAWNYNSMIPNFYVLQKKEGKMGTS